MLKKLIAVLCLLAMMVPVLGCSNDDGPMQKAGAKADQTAVKIADEAKETVLEHTEEGPMEKAGEKMDEAGDKFVNDAKNAAQKAKNLAE